MAHRRRPLFEIIASSRAAAAAVDDTLSQPPTPQTSQPSPPESSQLPIPQVWQAPEALQASQAPLPPRAPQAPHERRAPRVQRLRQTPEEPRVPQEPQEEQAPPQRRAPRARPAPRRVPQGPEVPLAPQAPRVSQSASGNGDCSGLAGGHRAAGRVVLTQWSLELVPLSNGRKAPVVRGIRTDQQGPCDMMWRTCEIADAVTPTLLVTTQSAAVQLVGPLSRPLAQKLRLPARLARSFSQGFPVKEWHNLIACSPTKRVRAQTPPVGKVAPEGSPDLRRQTLVPPPQPAVANGPPGSLKRRGKPPAPIAWAPADLEALKQALAKVRPSAPHFWWQVALLVSRPPEECRARAFGPRGQSPARKRGRRAASGERGGCGEARGDQGQADEEVQPSVASGAPPTVTSRREGPRRTQQVRQLLNATSFGGQRDLLQLPVARRDPGSASSSAGGLGSTSFHGAGIGSTSLGESGLGNCRGTLQGSEAATSLPVQRFTADATRAAVEPAAAEKVQHPERQDVVEMEVPTAPSPNSLHFLDSLHTGCTPPAKSRPLARRLFDESVEDDALAESEADEDAPRGGSLWSTLDLGDGTWQPKGVDSFICDAQARRRKLADGGAAARAKGKNPARVALPPRRRGGLAARLGAPADWGAGVAACFRSPIRGASESEEDVAPVAAIPRALAGLVETPSVGSDLEEDDC